MQRYRETKAEDGEKIALRLLQLSDEIDKMTMEAAALLQKLLDYRAICSSIKRSMPFFYASAPVGARPALHWEAREIFNSFIAQLDCVPVRASCRQGHALFPACVVFGCIGANSTKASVLSRPCIRCSGTVVLNGWVCPQCTDAFCDACTLLVKE